MPFEPRFTVTPGLLSDLEDITRVLTKASMSRRVPVTPRLRRVNRLKSLHSSLSIEGNSLSLGEVEAVVDGKTVIGPKDEIKEVQNANEAYKRIQSYDPFSVKDLLDAHSVMMDGLIDSAGTFRKGREGVFDADGNLIHYAPPPEDVPMMIDNLLEWVRDSDYPMILKSSVFHYQFEYIHPFEDGNGRVGRLWQTVLLTNYDSIFEWIPVESIIRSYQKDYYDSIETSNSLSDCTHFLEFMTGSILKALEESIVSSTKEELSLDSLSDTQLELYGMIRDGYFRDIDQASSTMGISKATLNRCLKSLRESGLIVKEGNRKSGVWKVTETDRESS